MRLETAGSWMAVHHDSTTDWSPERQSCHQVETLTMLTLLTAVKAPALG